MIAEALSQEQGWTLIGVLGVLVTGLLRILSDQVKVQRQFAATIGKQGQQAEAAGKRCDAGHERLHTAIERVPEAIENYRARKERKETA